MSSQFAFPNLKIFLGLLNVYCGFISASVTTIAWSEIPGAFAVDLINDGFVVNTKSNRLSSLVGSLCICERLSSDTITIKYCCSFLSCVVFECFKHKVGKPNWRTSIFPCLHKLGFHIRMLVRSKDLSAVKCKNDA